MPITIKAELRKYQQEGVNWLAFLAKYQLHGILCDGKGIDVIILTSLTFSSRHGSRKDFAVDLHFSEQTF